LRLVVIEKNGEQNNSSTSNKKEGRQRTNGNRVRGKTTEDNTKRNVIKKTFFHCFLLFFDLSLNTGKERPIIFAHVRPPSSALS